VDPRSAAAAAVDPLRLPDVRVSDCTDAHIYLLCPVRRLTLVACTDVTLFVAAAASLSVLSCERVAVHAASRRLLITNTFNSTLYVAVNAPPVVVGDSRGLRFAPYNAVYPAASLAAAAAAAGVDGAVNAWRDFRSPPLKAGAVAPAAAALAEAGVATIVRPDELIPFSVPTLDAVGSSRDGGGGGDGKPAAAPVAAAAETAAPAGGGDATPAAAASVAAAAAAAAAAVPGGVGGRDLRPSLLAIAAPLPAEYRASLERRVEEFEALRRVVCSFELRPVGGAAAAAAVAAPASADGGDAPAVAAPPAVAASTPNGAATRGAADAAAAPGAGAGAAAASGAATPIPNGGPAAGGAPATASVHSVVTAHFREWLSSSNNMRQLQELVALSPEQHLQ